MATKTISFTLDASSIAKAIRELEQYRDDLVNAVNELVRKLTEDGIRVAAVNVQRLGALDTGELADSFMGFYDEVGHMGFLRTDCWYAVFVEYGTGVVGQGGPPHPGPWVPPIVLYKNRIYTQHDTYGHGDNGWWYISEHDGHKHWTKGQPSRPFFYQTYMELAQMAQQEFGNLQI